MELLSGLSTLKVSDTLTVNKLKANNSIGSNGQILASNGTFTYWTDPSDVLIAGANTNITYNDSGSANGSNGFTFDKSTNNVYIANSLGIGTTTPSYKLEVNGSFAATTKSFVIDHPTKENKRLRYSSLEGPENGVYVRGKLAGSDIIELPDYWTGLVDEFSITVNLTVIGCAQSLYVKEIKDNKVFIKTTSKTKPINCFYTVYGERKDVEKLEVEI